MKKPSIKDKVADFIVEEYKKYGITKSKANDIFDSIINILTEEIQSAERTPISGFGIFKTKERKAREGRNPQTGEKIAIPARTVVSFSPSTTLKEKVNTNS
ncbi:MULTISPECIES: HU family DNA-binding protein [unclassified Spiroplasma]|uniref:HU family DNA-binding protein n=1 Tax=unclassified Spiroplasma TaxID=2637901 RepID=UPI001C057025|nr:HU family DNA-binding protein [Spiroplasma endosymbiont of 'Nebria riversi']